MKNFVTSLERRSVQDYRTVEFAVRQAIEASIATHCKCEQSDAIYNTMKKVQKKKSAEKIYKHGKQIVAHETNKDKCTSVD